MVAGWEPRRAQLLYDAALLHDVGKIGVPDQILLKPHPLTPAEYEQVKAHAGLGAELLADLLTPEQVDWVRHHHERPDGRGYPDGLTATQIPDGAALLAVADAWDAMTVARPYGAARPRRRALTEMRRGTDTQFTPSALDALFTLQLVASSSRAEHGERIGDLQLTAGEPKERGRTPTDAAGVRRPPPSPPAARDAVAPAVGWSPRCPGSAQWSRSH